MQAHIYQRNDNHRACAGMQSAQTGPYMCQTFHRIHDTNNLSL